MTKFSICRDEITCPHCYSEWSDSWTLEDYGETVCEECGQKFSWSRSVSVEYQIWEL